MTAFQTFAAAEAYLRDQYPDARPNDIRAQVVRMADAGDITIGRPRPAVTVQRQWPTTIGRKSSS